VIATYTRLAFDRESLREHRFFVFYLPVLAIGATAAIALGVGAWTIATIYLYWQWFHYTRQSWGISRAYQAKSRGAVSESPWFSKLCFYLVPVWGILHRSRQASEKFLYADLWGIPIPDWLADGFGVAALLSVLAWGLSRLRAARAGRLPQAHTWYMISHFTIFAVGYGLVEDITHGWLVINIWHNAQYLLFGWLFNTNRFRRGVDDRARLLSTMSQPNNVPRYVMACLEVTTGIYALNQFLTHGQLLMGVPAAVILYQAINFHHYIVDSRIWKIREKPMQKTLGLSTG
jgi:hypothetical protein